MTSARTISSDDIARVIYDAAADGTDRLRYLVGDDTRSFVHARQEMPDQDSNLAFEVYFDPQQPYWLSSWGSRWCGPS